MIQIKSCEWEASIPTFGEDGVFEGYASMFNVIDSHQDSVQPGAFKKSLMQWKTKGQLPKMLWQHDPQQVIGVWTHMFEDAIGLYVKGKLLLELEKAKEAYALMKAKAIDSLSIGYQVVRSHHGKQAEKSVQFLQEIDVMEVSLVTFASNAHAKIEHVKALLQTRGATDKEIQMFCEFMAKL